MNKSIIGLVVIALVLLTSISLASASNSDWTLNLNSQTGIYSSTSTIGVNSGATTGFDLGLDVVVPPPPPTGIHSYLYSVNNPTDPLNLQCLSTNLYPTTLSLWNWTLKVQNVDSSQPINISWSSADIPTAYMAFTPVGGQTINMKTTNQYVFTAPQGSINSFNILAWDIQPTPTPTPTSSVTPSPSPTALPTQTPFPSITPSAIPTDEPTDSPTDQPTITTTPTAFPTFFHIPPTPAPLDPTIINYLIFTGLGVTALVLAITAVCIKKRLSAKKNSRKPHLYQP